MNDWAAGDIKGAEKWATHLLFQVGAQFTWLSPIDFQADRFLSFSLPAMCIDQSLAAIYMPWRCQIVVLRRRALFIMMMCRQRRPPARKKRRITHFFYVASYLCRSSAFVRAACDDDATGPDRCASKTNCVPLLYLLSCLRRETPPFCGVCSLLFRCSWGELKINCVSFNL